MRLTADRLEVAEGERVHAVMLVEASPVRVLAAGGVPHLVHALEDVGFRDVRAWRAPPPFWGHAVPPLPSDLDWLLWVAATPTRSASYDRALTEDLRVLDAWPAEDELEELSPLHPYATAYAAPARFAGVVHVFGAAYPLEGLL